jgi:hydroxypyruvate isomerase
MTELKWPRRYAANISIMFQEYPFLERFAAARAAGFEAVECWFPYEHSVPELRAALDEQALQLVTINTAAGDAARGEWGIAALPGREAEFRSSVERAFEYAGSLGAPFVHVMASIVAPELPAELAQRTYRSNLEWAVRRAEKANVTVVIEPLNPRDRPGYLLARSDDAARIIESIASERLKMMFDMYHVQISEGDVPKRLARHWRHVGHMQIASVPARGEPDEGELDYRAVLRATDELDWSGWIGCEYRPRGRTEAGLSWRERLA